MALNPANGTDIQFYIRQWLTTVSPHLVSEFSYGTVQDPFERMRIGCKKCGQTLTCSTPVDAHKIDWAMQKFAGLHTHQASSGLSNKNEKSNADLQEVVGDWRLKILKATIDANLGEKQMTSTGTIPKTKWIEVPIVPEKPKIRPWRPKDGRRFRESN